MDGSEREEDNFLLISSCREGSRRVGGRKAEAGSTGRK